MRFAEPAMLYLLLALPVLLALAVFLAGRRQAAVRRFAGDPANVARFREQLGPHRRAVKAILLAVAATCLVITAAGPQWGTRVEEVHGRGVDVVVLMDTSLSMAAEDVAPGRFDLARLSASTLLQRLGGNRVALVTFAGEAATVCPLTLDLEAVRLLLDAVDLDAAPIPGTSLLAGVDAATRAFGPIEFDDDRERVIVLYTDGEDHEEGVERVHSMARNAGIQVIAIGVGTPEGGPIPIKNADGTVRDYKKDREDRVVTTRLDESALESIAVKTGGRYYRATTSGIELDGIVEAITGLEGSDTGTLLRTRYEERFQVPLVLAILALLAETMISDRGRRRATPLGGRT